MNSKMRTFGRAAALAGAISLMGWIIIAQRDYQQSFHEALVQTHPVNDAVSAVPGRPARAGVATYLGGNCRVRADRRDSPRDARPTAANIEFLLR
jgi:hypothetical protein